MSDLPACAGTGDLMFPDLRVSKAVKAALAMCEECPVRAQCLQDALARGERFGVWGGRVLQTSDEDDTC